MKTLLLLRALSGSGKSTLARKLENDYGTKAVICCNDDYLYYGKEKILENYDWTPDGAHNGFLACFDKFKSAINDNKELIIIDNTNIRKRDIKDFIQVGAESSYEIILHSITGFSANDSFNNNIHKVPFEICLKKFRAFKACENPLIIKDFQYHIKEVLHNAWDIRKGIYETGSF